MKGLSHVLRLAAMLVVALIVVNCASGGQSTMLTADGMSQEVSLPSPYTAETDTSANYRIAPNDLLQVTVFQVPDLSGPSQVDGDGKISMALIGSVDVKGKTTDQAEKEIAARLSKSYLRRPQVRVLVAKSAQRVTVNGAVARPGVMTVDGSLTLSQAIAASGGLTEIGNSSRIHVARMVGQQVKDVVFDLEAIQAGKAADPNLYGGDIIVAEQSGTRVALKTVKDLLPFAMFLSFL